jgi:hypothetical protein
MHWFIPVREASNQWFSNYSVEGPGSAATSPSDELQFYRILQEVALIVTYNTMANNELYF